MSTRNEILDAACAAFVEVGLEGFSVRDVAGRVGLTPMAIYRHFKNKDHLLHHIQQRGMEMWAERLTAARRHTDPRERLVEIAADYLRFAEEHPHYFRLMFLEVEGARDLKSVTAEGAEAIERIFQIYAAYVAECFPEAEDVATEAVALWAQNHGLVSLHLAGRLRFLPGDFALFHRARVAEYISHRRNEVQS